ncbi:MAG: sulfatase-like hydrolase/transferase [Clostridia bacterium]|nr:sulfatase-like hydrolase/transferase [Clostridia bacterium]
MEIFTFVMLGLGVFPEYYLFDVAIILAIAGFIFIIPNYLAQYIVAMFLILVQIVLCYANYTLSNLYGDIFSIEMFNLFAEAATAVVSDFTSFTILFLDLMIFAVIGCIGWVIFKTVKGEKTCNKKNFSLAIVMILFICQGFGVGIFNFQKSAIYNQSNLSSTDYMLSDRSLMETNLLKAKTFSKLGTFGFYVNNINIVMNDSDLELKEKALNYFNSGEITEANQNDENVIVIMAESLDWFAVNELTPNINALMDESIVYSNFFSKNKTNIAECLAFLGSYPTSKLLYQATNSDTAGTFDFSIPNILNDCGYKTSYFHSYYGNFYGRSTTYNTLGFEETHFLEEITDEKVAFHDFPHESDYVNAMIDEIIPYTESNTQKFFSFYTTLSTHGPYDINTKNLDQTMYRQVVLQSDWYQNFEETHRNLTDLQKERIANYIASVISLDDVIGIIVDDLKEKGIYDNTNIVLYGDHNCYYHNNTFYYKNVDISKFNNFDVNNVPLIIKTSKTVSESNPSRFCTATDIAPTVLDILGVSYNKNLYAGNSLFDEISTYTVGGVEIEVPTFFSHTGGVFSRYLATYDWNNFEIIDQSIPTELVEDYKDAFVDSGLKLLTKYNYINLLYYDELYKEINTNS